MIENRSLPTTELQAGLGLKTYAPEIELSGLTVGIDNIHFDVFLSPRFTELARKYLLKSIRQIANLGQSFGQPTAQLTPSEGAAFRRLLSELLHQSLTQAKYEKKIERDLLVRIAVMKFFAEEIIAQFGNIILEAKEWIRARGEHFERGEQAHVLKAKISNFQARRKDVFRRLGQNLRNTLVEVEETSLAKTRRALFGEEFALAYGVLKNRLVFVEGGKDDQLFLEHYVLVGNYVRDPDRYQAIDDAFVDYMRDVVFEAATSSVDQVEAAKLTELEKKAAAVQELVSRLDQKGQSNRSQVEKGDGWLSAITGQSPSTKAGLDQKQMESQAENAKAKLAVIEGEIEAVKRKLEFASEQERARYGVYLNQQENAASLFGVPGIDGSNGPDSSTSGRRLDSWIRWLEDRQLLPYILASIEMKESASEFCPPIHLQQLKRAFVNRDDLRQVEQILKQTPARQLSIKRIEDAGRRIRRLSRGEIARVVFQFTEGFMRLRHDVQDYQRLSALMERIHLVRNEKTRELSGMNNSLYECLLADEARPVEDKVITHTVIKADVRGSTTITNELLARGLNPAAHFSINLHEPVSRLLETYGAAKVFIEGDAIVLAIFELESNRTYQRSVSKACVLSRQILSVCQGLESRSAAESLPALELGVGIAFQGSAPTYWTDGDSRIMISRALNRSDRLSSCSKVARRLLKGKTSPFNVFLFQTVIEGASEEEAEEFLIRYNLNGIELNEEGFAKLSEEISLHPVTIECLMPWGKENVPLFYGELPIGEGIQSIVVRRGVVRELRPGGEMGSPLAHLYYEVCTSPSLLNLVASRVEAGALQI